MMSPTVDHPQPDAIEIQPSNMPPIYTIPFEVIWDIFQEVCDAEPSSEGFLLETKRPAMIFSSVSSHWRRIVFAMPWLWERLCFHVTRKSSSGNAALLQHYASHANTLNVSISCSPRSNFGNPDFQPITRALFSSDITPKIKALKLVYPPDEWIPLLSSFAQLETLAIARSTGRLHLQLQSLRLTRVHLFRVTFEFITLPASVKALHLSGMAPNTIMSLLRQCPNLTESLSYSGSILFSASLGPDHLRKAIQVQPMDAGSPATRTVQMMQLPPFDSLKLINLPLLHPPMLPPTNIIWFCHQLCANLVSLTLERLEWTLADLRHLFRFPIPNLQVLKLEDRVALPNDIRALMPSEEEYNNWEIGPLPNIRSLTLRSENPTVPDWFPRLVLDLLEKRRAGKTCRFDLDFTVGPQEAADKIWKPELRDELRRIVYSRQVYVKRASREIEWL